MIKRKCNWLRISAQKHATHIIIRTKIQSKEIDSDVDVFCILLSFGLQLEDENYVQYSIKLTQ